MFFSKFLTLLTVAICLGLSFVASAQAVQSNIVGANDSAHSSNFPQDTPMAYPEEPPTFNETVQMTSYNIWDDPNVRYLVVGTALIVFLFGTVVFLFIFILLRRKYFSKNAEPIGGNKSFELQEKILENTRYWLEQDKPVYFEFYVGGNKFVFNSFPKEPKQQS